MSDHNPPQPEVRAPAEPVKLVRRFKIEPVETSRGSNKREQSAPEPAAHEPPKKRFLPQPVETTHKSHKNPLPLPTPPAETTSAGSTSCTPTPPSETPTEENPKPRRRFAPQLIESVKRMKRAGNSSPASLPTDKTDITPGTNHIYAEERRRIPRADGVTTAPGNLRHIDIDSRFPPLPPRRQQSMKPHLNTRRSTRTSYHTELEPIESVENSENSQNSVDGDSDDTPSLSGSMGSSEDSIMRHARTRESCDDRFSGYLLALAAKAAEKQLLEQALAAFPNESAHEVVEHFYDREFENGSDTGLSDDTKLELAHIESMQRRKSTEIGWATREMQQHQENLSRQREDETNQKIAQEASQPTFPDPFWTNGMTNNGGIFSLPTAKGPVDKVKEAELARMRSAASPPMLGEDLKFRMCPSPKATKFETDQRIDVQPHRVDDGGGLWNGYCVAEEPGELLSPAPIKPTMIHTPGIEREDPFSTAFSAEVPKETKGSAGRQGGVKMLAGFDDRMQADAMRSKAKAAVLEEFDDKFVTQVYNYLSLGYPALARSFDKELARISGFSEAELCVDDGEKGGRGYIGLVAIDGEDVGGMRQTGEKGPRWNALKKYIFEWGMQHPSMSNGALGPAAWARRGSWRN